jgi:hypothetical protein
MFNVFKKNKTTTPEVRMLETIVSKCNENPGGYYGCVVLSASGWKSIRYLNKRGLIKYFKTDNPNSIKITLTLFCLYLTKIKKYDIEKVYNEATSLYNLVGGERNGVRL